MSRTSFDILIIGGGIIGVAVAYKLLQHHSALDIGLIEKEPRLAMHQTGRNSGVIHSGIYYAPGSLKAQLAVAGRHELVQFCRHHDILHEMCGKLIVATSRHELARLDELQRRAFINLPEPVHRMSEHAMREIEPHVRGMAGLHVPCTGIVDFAKVCEVLAEQARRSGATIVTQCCFQSMIDEGEMMRVCTSRGEFMTRFIINCAGLYSDRVARTLGAKPQLRIVPFRGEYLTLTEEAQKLIRHLIYPVPDPRFPFLGVHFTRMMRGGVEVGPNAVLAFAREGYRWRDIHTADMLDYLRDFSFWRMAMRYGATGLGEWYRSLHRAALAKAAQRLVPDLRVEHLQPGGAGVRAQALGPGGRLLDDFAIIMTDRVVNVCNAPSPAATASLAIADYIAGQLQPLLRGKLLRPRLAI